MNEMSNVRKRIQNRRYGETQKSPLLFRLFYKLLMFAMALGVIALAFLVNDKVGWVKIPADWQLQFAKVSEWLPFDSWFQTSDGEEMVSAMPAYSLLNRNQYANGSNQAYLLMDGVVLHVEEKDGAQSSVTVRHDNGVIVTYGHLQQVQVKQDERLQKGDIAGSFSEYVTLDMVKNKQSVDLPTALQP